ncbi:MAG: hypothetical protein ACHQ6U_04410 [Thermodesulfobacteriota bacterium]
MSKKDEGTVVVNSKDGGPRWRAKWTDEEFTDHGEARVRTTLTGQGIRDPFTRNMSWESVSVWKPGPSFTPVESSTEVRDLQGKLVMTDSMTIDDKTGKVSFVRKDYEADGTVSKSYKPEGDLLIEDGLVLALRSLPFGTDKTVKVRLLTGEPDLYDVEFKQKGVEKINTPEGEIECYKVELVPKLGVLNMFKVFFPKTYFWFTVTPPHRWVRYVGLENGRNSPEVVMEAESFQESEN